MGTEISGQRWATDGKTGLTLPLIKHLGSQELAKHKASLSLELEVLAKKFDRFGWDRDRGSYAQERQLIDWMDALQDYPLQEVRRACAQAVLSNPNKMPNEGHVRAAILSARAQSVAAQRKHDDAEREVPIIPTSEQKRRIDEYVKQAGYNVASANRTTAGETE